MGHVYNLNIAKGTTDPRVEFSLTTSYHKFKHKSWSNFIFRISTKHQLLNQASASPINLKFKILTKLSFENSTKIQLNNLYKTPAKKTGQAPAWTAWTCLNFNFNILTKPCAQSLNKRLAFWPNLSFEICSKLLPTWSSSATVTTSTSFELASLNTRVISTKFTKQELVSELVS